MTLIHGDAAQVLQHEIEPRSIDMAYLDPPFGNEQVWKGRAGSFDDRWQESERSAEGWARLNLHNPSGAAVLMAAASTANRRAYLGAMAGIVLGVHRVLKLTGTLWLHFDGTMGAYLRLLGAAVFGPTMEVGTLIWRRTNGGHGNAKGFGRIHDTIACFARSTAALWRLCSDAWAYRFDGFAEAAPLAQGSKERVGYPTQKPVALLAELIRAATLPGNRILDATCGSGTALVAAQRLGRRAIGIDSSADAIRTAGARLAAVAPRQAAFDFGSAA